VHGCSKSAFLLNANEELFLAQDTHLLLKRIENILTLENVDKLCGFVAKIREILQTPVMLSVVSSKTCGIAGGGLCASAAVFRQKKSAPGVRHVLIHFR
jgi:hypothetical protein